MDDILIEFTDSELAALHVPEYSFAGFLASLLGKMMLGQRLYEQRGCGCEEDEAATFV